MSTDKPFPAMPTAPPKTPEPIKVRALRFSRPTGVDLGSPFPSNPIILAAGKRSSAGGDEIQIQYEPWHRQFRARCLVDGAVTAERCIPESWAIYEPEPA